MCTSSLRGLLRISLSSMEMATHKSTQPKATQDVKKVVEKTFGKPAEVGVNERLVDFEYEYVSELLSDARQMSQHSGKRDIDIDDLKLAKEMLERSACLSQRPSKQTLALVAQKANEAPLPALKPHDGLRLPDRFCMMSCNYQTADVVDSQGSPAVNGSV